MAAMICDVPVLVTSLVNSNYSNLPLDSRRILEWHCVPQGCGKMWKESVSKRSKYTKCPECEPKGRKAKVYIARSADVRNVDTAQSEQVTKVENPLQECPVCVLPAKLVICGFCDFECCKECMKTYILSTSFEAKCMKCETKYNTKYLVETFGKKWFNGRKEGEYTNHLTKVWIEQERAKFPSTYPLIPVYREYTTLNRKITAKQVKLEKILSRAAADQPDDLAGNDVEKYYELLLDRNVLEEQREAKLQILYGDTNEAPSVQGYLQGCPNGECRGMIESETCKCTVCDAQVCGQCHALYANGKQSGNGENSDKHVCSLNDLETVRSMKANTKPCPGCASPIYKIDGCDQMWCVMCKVAFSWTTGRQEKGRLHNPHYYEWLRSKSATGEIPHEQGDECGVPHIGLFYELTSRISEENRKWMREVFTRIYTKAVDDRVHADNTERQLIILRIGYLMSGITEKSWTTNVHRMKKWEKDSNSLQELAEGTRALLSELLIAFHRDLVENPDTADAIVKFQENVEKARLYINECIHSEFIYKPSKSSYEVYNAEWRPISGNTDK